MSVLTSEDYTMLVTGADLEALKPELEEESETLSQAENTAQEEITGYLRNRYDVSTIFSEEEARNPMVIMTMIDITLWHLSAKLPGRMNYDIRKERYEAALSWLEKVNKGLVNPGLPLIDDTDPGNPIKFASQRKKNPFW